MCQPYIESATALSDIYVCGRKKYLNRTLEIYSPNIRSRTSRRIYRLALPLCAPEMLSSLSKSRISIFNAHHTLFVRRMTRTIPSVSISSFSLNTWNLERSVAICRPDDAELERSERLELHCLLL